MNNKPRLFLLGTAMAVIVVTSFGFEPASQSSKSAPAPVAAAPAPAPQDHGQQLPPGMSEADMQACAAAATPGEQHKQLAQLAGTWKGKSRMWMGPGAEPMSFDCTNRISEAMDGRFVKSEFEGEMPGMGPFHGLCYAGFDNVSKTFQSTWIDNHSTGIMVGKGELSADGKTMTWNYTFNCPITQKPTMMREIEQFTGADSMTVEMFTTDPNSGKEYRMMEVSYTRQGGTTAGSR